MAYGPDIEALAEAWASMDGKLDRFRACKADAALEDVDGSYGGYMHEAAEVKRRMEARGFTIVPTDAARKEPT